MMALPLAMVAQYGNQSADGERERERERETETQSAPAEIVAAVVHRVVVSWGWLCGFQFAAAGGRLCEFAGANAGWETGWWPSHAKHDVRASLMPGESAC